MKILYPGDKMKLSTIMCICVWLVLYVLAAVSVVKCAENQTKEKTTKIVLGYIVITIVCGNNIEWIIVRQEGTDDSITMPLVTKNGEYINCNN